MKQYPETSKRGEFQDPLFSLTVQPVRINNPGAPLLGLAKLRKVSFAEDYMYNAFYAFIVGILVTIR